MKICTKCEIEKPLSEFGKDSRARDGKRSECRRCKSVGDSAYRSENRDRVSERKARWASENRDRMNASNAAWRSRNKAQVARYAAQWRADNEDHWKAYSAGWRSENRDKLRLRDARRRARKACAVPQRWVKRDDVPEDLCYWCGSDDIAHLEHLHPIALGGPAVASNEHMACVDCNLRKSDKHPLVWIAELVMEV